MMKMKQEEIGLMVACPPFRSGLPPCFRGMPSMMLWLACLSLMMFHDEVYVAYL